MSDSVDRVFSHALNTVNKIRTGSQKPPSATRLRLYGLYKQAMEGDVDGIMERPDGNSEQDQRAREKWDAWKQQNGLSRTEAKRRYITTLIDTMHKFASPSPDSRELVAELEFVWDQVKSNVPSSSSSSPLQTLSQMGMHMPPSHSYLGESRTDQRREDDDDDDPPLRVKSPMSQSEEELEEEEAEIDREEFVDAPDSQYNPNSEHVDEGVQTDLDLIRQNPMPVDTPTPAPRMRSLLPQSIPMPNFTLTPSAPAAPPYESAADKKWRGRVEQALQKMTAEVAALREQLEARRLFSHSPHYRLFRGIWRWAWAAVKHLAVDVFILGIVLLWMRRRKDRRLEGAIRVLLGDAVAQVQKVGGAQLGKVKLPIIGGKKSS
ncbi:acyl CoA binding protein-domain-containing protein [Paraphoma chrysanthemicola]|uniref:Acyl CoA binding protein-domain-containing protein n=1 Tax=Paraphoma chrysanthemicola TaxID=798071 RepID=A0A8K0W0L1_9PLEO|nr:acyl CoA binding protein-domain-containing protein [Paraphoma chrysanthemicola]